VIVFPVSTLSYASCTQLGELLRYINNEVSWEKFYTGEDFVKAAGPTTNSSTFASVSRSKQPPGRGVCEIPVSLVIYN